MYPLARFAATILGARRAAPIGPLDTHVSRHVCWPWDIDPWMELNNGRTLTLYDLGRVGLGVRSGLMAALRDRGWGLAVAGASVRYRKRVTLFQRIEMRTRCVGWDERFIYIVQSMWVDGTCTSEALLRTAVTARRRAVPPAEVMAALGRDGPAPAMPGWVAAWIEAEGARPWPPEGTSLPAGHLPPG